MLSATLADVFPHVVRQPIESTNSLLVASRVRLSAARLRRAAQGLPPALRPVALRAARDVEPPLSGGEVYTDDRAPVEWLIDKSIVDYAASED